MGKEVAEAILNQMGGVGRISMMTGARQFKATKKGVAFRWPSRQRSRGNYLEVSLRDDDTYDVRFYTVGTAGVQIRKEISGVYADKLVSVFEKQTGLSLS